MNQEDFNHDRLTYSESRTINMGDYESTQCFFSFSTTYKERIGGKTSVTLRESATSKLMKTSPENFTKVAKKLVRRVREVLDEQELIIRKTCIEQQYNLEDEMQNKYNHLLKQKKAERKASVKR
jgi:hypothetical protein